MLPEPRKRQRAPAAPEGFKGCSSCQQIKPLGEFYRYADGRPFSRCRTCQYANKHDMPESPTLADRFWKKVDKDQVGTGCWEWIGAKNSCGYGMIYTGGRPYQRLAHRVCRDLMGLPLPPSPPGYEMPELVCDHMCKNVACVNPDHIRICTLEENISIYANREGVREKMLATWARTGFRPKGRPRKK